MFFRFNLKAAVTNSDSAVHGSVHILIFCGTSVLFNFPVKIIQYVKGLGLDVFLPENLKCLLSERHVLIPVFSLLLLWTHVALVRALRCAILPTVRKTRIYQLNQKLLHQMKYCALVLLFSEGP